MPKIRQKIARLILFSILLAAFGSAIRLRIESKNNQEALANKDQSTGLIAPFPLSENTSPGKNIFVSPEGDDSGTGQSPDQSYKSIQKAIDEAQPGDTVFLDDGIYYQDIISKIDGRVDAPIIISGTRSAVLKGAGSTHIIQINHSYITLQGFTVDGQFGEPQTKDGFRDKLVYISGTQPGIGVKGLRILNMDIKNAGGECIRMRYFSQQNEITGNSISSCGIADFRFNSGSKNGEGIYIGTAPEQRDNGKNPTSDVDASNNNWIHNNIINTQGNECVDIKEGSSGNIVEQNSCTGQKDPESGGLDSRGDGNIFRDNTIFDNVGVGIRLGGDGEADGIDNVIMRNTLRNNQAGAMKIERSPQGAICENNIAGNKKFIGKKAKEFKNLDQC